MFEEGSDNSGSSVIEALQWQTPKQTPILEDTKGRLFVITCIDDEGVDVKDVETGEINPYNFTALNLAFKLFDPTKNKAFVERIQRIPWVQDRRSREVFAVAKEDANSEGVLLKSIVNRGKEIRVSYAEFLCKYDPCHDLNSLPIANNPEVNEVRKTISVVVNDAIGKKKPSIIIKHPAELD
ncbi:hypothetical protein ACFL3C_01245 [Patescibacteria group bacterium]